MKVLGVALMILGGAVVVHGGLGSEDRQTLLQVSDVRTAATGHASVPASPVSGVIPLALGAAMLLRDNRRVG